MTNTPYEKSALAGAVLKLVPPLIRKSLLNEQQFREEYCLKTNAMITFRSSGTSVQRSKLFDAVRTVLAGKAPVEFTDAEGRTWRVAIDAHEDELPNIILSSDQQRLVLSDFSFLSGDAAIRIRYLEEFASEVNLPLSAQEKWRNILVERALEYEEIDTFQNDICDTPVHVERTIGSEILAGNSSVSSLVPRSRRYFERLVGAYDGSGSIRDYAVGVGSKLFGQLLEWRPYEGFLLSLLLSSHSALTAAIAAEIKAGKLHPEELEKAFGYIEEHGDMLSRLGAFEVGLHILPDRPEVEPFLLRIVHRIRDDDVEGKASEFKLFSALFVLVDGELARTSLLAEEPPFYRRLASLAQAALIHRKLVQYGVDYDHFSQWAFISRVKYFYMQSFADMRTEPRWNPDLADASQLQAHFFGRIIMIAGNNCKVNLGYGELRNTIFGDGDGDGDGDGRLTFGCNSG